MADENVALVSADDLAANHPSYSCELVAGRVVRVSPAGARHGIVVAAVIRTLSAFLSEHDLGLVTSGETGFLVARNPDSVRAPDVAFVSKAKLSAWKREGSTYFPSAPDLAVEVLSPDDRWVEVEQKAQGYLAAAGHVVWVLNPQSETVHVFEANGSGSVLAGDDELHGGSLLPGFAVRVSQLFTT